MNRRGPRTEPRGTHQEETRKEEKVLNILYLTRQSYKRTAVNISITVILYQLWCILCFNLYLVALKVAASWSLLYTGIVSVRRWSRDAVLECLGLVKIWAGLSRLEPKTEGLGLGPQRLVFTAMHGMQTRSCDENSVCLSVRLSVKRVHCDKTKKKSVVIFIPCERSFSLVFWEEEWLVGATAST